jgi:DNA-binding Lrp family transcriptional regulator
MLFFQLQGKRDIDIVFAARTIDEFESFLSKLLQEFNKIIEEKSISLVTQIIHYPKDYLIDKKREKVQKKEFAQAEIKIDEKDKNILRAISERASIPLIELASQTRLSINTLKDRLRKMEKSKIILGYRPFIETEKTGYQYFKFILFFKNYTRYNIDNVRNFFEKNEKLVYLTDYVNGGDIEAEMHLESEQEMLVLKSLLVEKFGQYIKEITTIKFYKEHLYRYLPQTL